MERRELLVRLLQWGAAGLWPWGISGCRTPPHQVTAGIASLEGHARVDGLPARLGMLVRHDQTLETGADSRLALVMHQDAFLVGPSTRLRFQPAITASRPLPLWAQAGDAPLAAPPLAAFDVGGVILERGRVLSVFAPGNRLMRMPRMDIGIRGTGLFMQADADQDYLCLCYGSARVTPTITPDIPRDVNTRHHESPMRIEADAPHQLVKASMLNHTDDELILLESLVGRRPPFSHAGDPTASRGMY
ncbi:MAG: hypothetical protein H7831_12105 [Magnetococcus sp. WYHC-3]